MTGGLAAALCLLAIRQDMYRVWGRFDHQHPSDGTNQMLILFGLAALLAVAMFVWLRAVRGPQRHFTSNSPSRLFRELCRVHGLNFSTRRLLKRLAAARGLPSAALLFVEPEHYDTSNLPANLQPAASELQRLHDQFFR
jgi:hypothetical protein